MADKMLDPTSLEARMKYGKESDLNTFTPEEESLMDIISRKSQEYGEEAGLSRAAARKLGGAAEFGASVTPAGDVDDLRETEKALSKGEYGEAAVASLGFVPIIGGALKKGAKATMELFRAGDEEVKQVALRITSEKLGRIPNPNSKEDVKTLLDTAAEVEFYKRGNEPVSFGRNKRDVYHGVKDDPENNSMKRTYVEEGGSIDTSPHAELGTDTVSTSSDPIYSARHFADSDIEGLYEGRIPEDTNILNMSPSDYEMQRDGSINIQEGIDETTATLKPEVADIYGMDADTPITMDEMEMWGIPEEDLDFKSGEPFAARIPKVSSFNSEAETIVGDPSSLNFMKITEHPEKAEFIRQGIAEANEVFATQDAIIEALDMQDTRRTPAQAKQLYNQIRDNLKRGASLAKYTEDNSARGTYDWFVANWAKKANPHSIKYLATELPEGQMRDNVNELARVVEAARTKARSIEARAADPVVGREISNLGKISGQDRSEIIKDALAELEAGYMDQEEFEAVVKAINQRAKKGMMPLTDKFAKGGLVS